MFIGKLVYLDGYICISRLQCLKMCKFSLNMKKTLLYFIPVLIPVKKH